MKTPSDVKEGKVRQWIKLMSCGSSGDGKTHLASTFPKNVFAITEPSGEDTFLNKPELLKNVVGWEHFIPSNDEELREMYKKGGSFEKFLAEVRQMAIDGKVETFTLDNFTYYTDNKWNYIKKFELIEHTTKSGAFDTQSAYGSLRDDLYEFVVTKILTLPCNVVLSVHIMTETDEAMEKKLDKTETYSPQILGSFRDRIKGMFSYVFYLTKLAENKDGKTIYKYKVRTNKGGGKAAKSRLSLPEIIENASYQTIISEIQKAKGVQ